MSLEMDHPVHLQRSLAAAKQRVTAAARIGSKKTKNRQTKGSKAHDAAQTGAAFGGSKLSAVRTLSCHAALGAVAALFVYTCGIGGFVATVVVGFLVTVAFATLDITNPLLRAMSFINTTLGQEAKRKINVDQWITGYNDLHQKDSDYIADGDKAGVEKRNSSYTTLVNAYYELATLFYEIGWGTSFHFATRRKNESFKESIKRHEYFLASKLGQNMAGKRIIDVGCGVGGPYRNIATFTGGDVTGITLNEYQVQRGNRLSAEDGLLSRCRSVQGDFMKLPFEDESFDGAYAIEATCHAPSREGVYSEIYRVLKPGSVLAMYEWCLTPKYDASNSLHRKIKKQIEEGDGLPDMARTTEIDDAVSAVGFEVLESRDVALDSLPGDISWYTPLTPSWNIFTQRFQFTGIGKWLTTKGLRLLELLRLAPAGTCKVQTMLLTGGEGCYRGGELGIFTPMYMCVVRKPLVERNGK